MQEGEPILEVKVNYKNENVIILNNAKVASTFVNFHIGDGGHVLDLSDPMINQNRILSICKNVREIICLVKDPRQKLISSLHHIYMTGSSAISEDAEHIKRKLTGNGDVSDFELDKLKKELLSSIHNRKIIQGEFQNETHTSLHHLSLNLFLTQLIANGFDTTKILVVDITQENAWFNEYISSGYTKMMYPSNETHQTLDKNKTPRRSRNFMATILNELESSNREASSYLKTYLQIENTHYDFLRNQYINKEI